MVPVKLIDIRFRTALYGRDHVTCVGVTIPSHAARIVRRSPVWNVLSNVPGELYGRWNR
jgi:hypothetical protein